ncbi:phospholipase [Salinarimonas sp.]|uniref:alpha/beta hydrolase n=1 Tax=Salinarimonas sp. TaxID=2766526 RepID=UPI0032D91161
MAVTALHRRGLLSARPGAPEGAVIAPGTHGLRQAGLRDGLLFVPGTRDPARPAGLLLMLHGAGAGAMDVLPMVSEAASRRGVVVLCPESEGATWDLLQRDYGPDVARIDEALAATFDRLRIDPVRMALAGFSDGASYALSLGLANPALFADLIAFSPGFVAPTPGRPHPRIFVCHGRDDRVLPIDRCGRRVAQRLARDGYDVDWRDFAGGHVVPADMVEAALDRAFTA